jgi:hypothetical protein
MFGKEDISPFIYNIDIIFVMYLLLKKGEDILTTKHIEFFDIQFLLWPDDGSYEPKHVSKVCILSMKCWISLWNS